MAWYDMFSLLTRREVCAITGLSRTTLWRYEGDGRFPVALRLPGGGLRWLAINVFRWIEALPSGREEAHARWKRLVEKRRGREREARLTEERAAQAAAGKSSPQSGAGSPSKDPNQTLEDRP